MNGPRFDPRLTLGVLYLAVVAGIIAMVLSHAPRGYALGNASAAALATALAVLPVPHLRAKPRAIAVGALALALVLTALAGQPLDGVRRWVAAGPVRLHVGMLLGPALAVLLADAPPRLRGAGLLGAFGAALAAPDLAMALGWMGFVLARVGGEDRRSVGIVIVLAVTMVAITALRDDPLAPVAHVEGVVAASLHRSVAGGLALLAAQIAPLALIAWRDKPTRALAGFWAGLVLASLTGAWPSPLIGFGAAPILGFGLSIAVWRGLRLARLAA